MKTDPFAARLQRRLHRVSGLALRILIFFLGVLPGVWVIAASERAADSLALTVEEAVLRSLADNRSLRVERLNPPIQRTFEMEERASFDPVIGAEAAAAREKAETRAGAETRTNATGVSVGVSEYLPTERKSPLISPRSEHGGPVFAISTPPGEDFR